MAPLVGRLIDKLIPWYAALIGIVSLVCFQSMRTAAGGINTAAVIISMLGLDIFRQMLQVPLSTAVFGISASARSRLNAVLILASLAPQLVQSFRSSSRGAPVLIASRGSDMKEESNRGSPSQTHEDAR